MHLAFPLGDFFICNGPQKSFGRLLKAGSQPGCLNYEPASSSVEKAAPISTISQDGGVVVHRQALEGRESR